MAEFNLLDIMTINEYANSQSYSYWLTLGINLIVSTIISGLLLVVVLSVFSKKFGESVKLENAFLVVLIANIINYFGIMGFILPFIATVPFVGLAAPFLIWVVMLKLFFREISLIHVFIVSLVFYLVTLLIIPYIVGLSVGFLNF